VLDKSEVGKRGYLHEDYRLFHLRDDRELKLDHHYHEFDKLVCLLSGKTSYTVEGKIYFLQPMDILLVSRNMIHLPEVDPSEPYERIVLWINRDFLTRYSSADAQLASCFDLAAQRSFHLYRPRGEARERYRQLFQRVEEAGRSLDFGGRLMAETCMVQLMIELNRDMLAYPVPVETSSYRFDPKMEDVTHFVREHLGEELSIDRLAGEFFLSRYYLMHRFKEVYGCTIHQYIRQKRLQQASEQIRLGVPVLKAAQEAGFGDYSVFLRAFRSAYGCSPREWK